MTSLYIEFKHLYDLKGVEISFLRIEEMKEVLEKDLADLFDIAFQFISLNGVSEFSINETIILKDTQIKISDLIYSVQNINILESLAWALVDRLTPSFLARDLDIILTSSAARFDTPTEVPSLKSRLISRSNFMLFLHQRMVTLQFESATINLIMSAFSSCWILYTKGFVLQIKENLPSSHTDFTLFKQNLGYYFCKLENNVISLGVSPVHIIADFFLDFEQGIINSSYSRNISSARDLINDKSKTVISCGLDLQNRLTFPKCQIHSKANLLVQHMKSICIEITKSAHFPD